MITARIYLLGCSHLQWDLLDAGDDSPDDLYCADDLHCATCGEVVPVAYHINHPVTA